MLETGSYEERKTFYLHRALVLVNEGRYEDAISSARSDALKLTSNEMGAFGIGMDMLMFVNNKPKLNEKYAIQQIEDYWTKKLFM